MIVADTSWISALRDASDAHHATAAATSDAIGDEPVLIAAVTLGQWLVAPAQLGRLEGTEVTRRSAFEVEVADAGARGRWAATRAATGLRLRDTAVLATALHHRARGVATFDVRLAERCRDAGLEVLAARAPGA